VRYMIEFQERHSETALALAAHLSGIGIVRDETFGIVRRAGSAFFVAELSDAEAEQVEAHPDVVRLWPDLQLETMDDPLSGCEEEYEDPHGPLEGCDEPGDPDD
jgi:hypothetical protein